MNNKIIVGLFSALIGGMAVKVFKTMKDNKKVENEDELQN